MTPDDTMIKFMLNSSALLVFPQIDIFRLRSRGKKSVPHVYSHTRLENSASRPAGEEPADDDSDDGVDIENWRVLFDFNHPQTYQFRFELRIGREAKKKNWARW